MHPSATPARRRNQLFARSKASRISAEILPRLLTSWPLANAQARISLVLPPPPEVSAFVPRARSGTGPTPPTAGLACVADPTRELVAQLGGILTAQVDLVLSAVERKSHRLVRLAAVVIIFENDLYPLRH